MSKRENRLRIVIRQFLQEDPRPTDEKGRLLVDDAAKLLGLDRLRAIEIYREELNVKQGAILAEANLKIP